MDYKVLIADNSSALEDRVNMWISYGYKPLGGVSFIYHGGFRESWAQAMVKEK